MDQTEQVQQQQTPETNSSQQTSDPFVIDDVKLASLSPEQRAAIDPIFE